jgi:hypothetical protein
MRRRAHSESSAEKKAREKKLRTGGRNCPVCLALLPSMAGKPAGHCGACGGHLVPQRCCAKCRSGDVWEGGSNAGCAACGHHGSKVRVFAGQEWLKKADAGG